MNKLELSLRELSERHESLERGERAFVEACTAWLNELGHRINPSSEENANEDLRLELTGVIESLFSVSGSPAVNRLLGLALSNLVHLDRMAENSRLIMKRFLGPSLADRAERERKMVLVVNASSSSTKVALFRGIEKLKESELHHSIDVQDELDHRAETVIDWLASAGFRLDELDGIACRGGFVQPIPSGIYKVVPEMLHDVMNPIIAHPVNMSIIIGHRLAEMSGKGEDFLLITKDTVASDEMELSGRLTGSSIIHRDGTGAHYLNHKAVWRVLTGILSRAREDLDAVTAHIGGGVSFALHRKGRIVNVVDAFTGPPSASRCGSLSLPRLLIGINKNQFTLKDIEELVYNRGGLLSLAGTNDFRALVGFRDRGATQVQRQKIELILEFFAREYTAAINRLVSDGQAVSMVALTGNVTHLDDLVERIESNIAGRFPMVVVPGGLEHESLASGFLKAVYMPEVVKDYVTEATAMKNERREEQKLLEAPVFTHNVFYYKKDAPITSLNQLIDITRMLVHENHMPSIAIIGANNEEAILAAKRANEEGRYRVAKFYLVGDYAAISQIAYDFDLVIDNDNYTIVDAENPVEEALKLFEEGKVQILMKGKMHTEDILRGIFKHFKATGRIKSGELISHVAVMDIPRRRKLLMFSDAAINTYPDLEKRVVMLENSLKVARILNVAVPKVAVISAVENVNKSVESSIEAEVIASRFKDRKDCIVEGPLSLDVAMDSDIALEKGYKGAVKGNADILILPDIDAGNVLWKTLTTQSGAWVAGAVLCGDTPMILTSRGDSARSKLASISLAIKLYFDVLKRKG